MPLGRLSVEQVLHMSVNESISSLLVSGADMDDSSPYEPVAPNRHPDVFRLASISSGIARLTFSQRIVVFLMKGNIFWGG